MNIVEIIGLRQKAQLSQGAFWGRLGVGQSAGSRYESGRRIPSAVATLVRIAYGTPAEADKAVKALRSACTP